jgi:hypothetical protein
MILGKHIKSTKQVGIDDPTKQISIENHSLTQLNKRTLNACLLVALLKRDGKKLFSSVEIWNYRVRYNIVYTVLQHDI